MAPALVTPPGRILYLDAYDSFSNNIIALAQQHLDVEVVAIPIDDSRFIHDPARFTGYLKNFDAVIAGPGPGTVTNPKDVGLIRLLWELNDPDVLPVLGICLGFQSLAVAYGASIERLVEPRHGLIAEILHNGRSIFKGVNQVLATQYHSLQVNIGHPIQTRRAVSYPNQLWKSTESCPDLEPLAWDFDNPANGPVLMAIRHQQKPLWGVQFHPESICTNEEGLKILRNWWADAQTWILGRSVPETQPATHPHRGRLSMSNFNTLLDLQDMNSHRRIPDCAERRKSRSKMSISKPTCDPITIAQILASAGSEQWPNLAPDTVHVSTCGSGRLKVQDVAKLFEIPAGEAIVLESCVQDDLLPMKTGTGRYSIIGLVIPGETLRLQYSIVTQKLTVCGTGGKSHLETEATDVWAHIKSVMEHLKPSSLPNGPSFAPFWGGLMGYVSYEAGLETIGVEPSPSTENGTIPDICFAYITRSIVFDHKFKKIFVQSIRGSEDMDWVGDAVARISQRACELSSSRTPSPTSEPDPFETDAAVEDFVRQCTPVYASQDSYCAAVEECQRSIASGDSYELCLTSQNRLQMTPANEDALHKDPTMAWRLYNRLMTRNPAPFSAFVRLGNTTILSSSPERFISWDRNGCAQCRPIKGTVRKSPGVTFKDAEAILSSSKERAENLMIVDLVRHQLHGVYGAGNVNTTQLMEIEEYETLWQLVSVVEGVPEGVQKAKTPDEWENPPDHISGKTSSSSGAGLDAFVASLPPGSMTGAPKKRSCEILKEIENHRRRGIYSGVLGYLDVGGGGDFSVVIRTAVHVDGENEPSWWIGAGGAVTAQSTPEGEFTEMLAKFSSTANAFR